MIHVEDWAEIRRLHRSEGLSARAVARQLGISRNTVLRALASDRPPQYRRAAKGSAVDVVEPAIRELLQQTPTMPVTVIAERIGWERGLTVLRERVRELRPAYLPVDPVSRTVYQPGELAQCDLWFPPADIPLGYGQSGRPPVLVIVSGYSRVITARMLPSRQTGDLIDGHWRLLTAWGAVPRMLVWDNEAGIGKGRPTMQRSASPSDTGPNWVAEVRRARFPWPDRRAGFSGLLPNLVACSTIVAASGRGTVLALCNVETR